MLRDVNIPDELRNVRNQFFRPVIAPDDVNIIGAGLKDLCKRPDMFIFQVHGFEADQFMKIVFPFRKLRKS